MNKEEQFIERNFGRKMPFSVPDGYLENLSSHVIDALPERKADVIHIADVHKKPRFTAWIAACAVAAVLGVGIYLQGIGNDEKPQTVSAESPVMTYEQDVDAAVDYAMLDNEELYYYVSEE